MTKKEKEKTKKLFDLIGYLRYNNKNLTNKQYNNIDEAMEILKDLLKDKND